MERASSWINKVRDLLEPGHKVKGGQRLTWDGCLKRDIIECGLIGVNPSDRSCWRERGGQLNYAAYHGGLTPRLTSLSVDSRIIV